MLTLLIPILPLRQTWNMSDLDGNTTKGEGRLRTLKSPAQSMLENVRHPPLRFF